MSSRPLPNYVTGYFGGESNDHNVSLAFLGKHPSLLDALAPAAEDPVGEAVGDRVGGYELTRYLGGGMAEVYEGVAQDGVACAIKLSRTDPRSVDLVAQEAVVLSKCSHPGVVRLLATGREGGRQWIAMPLVAGGDLAQTIAQSPVSVTKALQWLLQIADALGYLHSCGFVHRDVKPANIVVDGDKAVLIDLGLVHRSSLAQGIRELAGTLPYMSPEQTLGGLAAVEPASDVYSVAATFYEVLTGVRVAELDGRERMLEAIAFAPVPRLSRSLRVAAAVDRIFARALNKDPEQRYRTAGELAEDVRAYVEGHPLRHAAEPLARRVGRLLRQYPWRVAAAAMLLLGCLAVVIGSWMSAASHRNQLLRAVLQPVRQGDFEVAANRFDEHFVALQHEPLLREGLRDHATRFGQALTQKVLRNTLFAVDGEVGPELLAAQSRAERLQALLGGPEFALQRAWLLLHRNRLADARAVLQSYVDASDDQQPDPRIVDLALVLAQQAGDAEQVKAGEAQLLGTSPRSPTIQEICFRAYRKFHRATTAQAHPSLVLNTEARVTLLQEAQFALELALQTDASPFAQMCLSLVAVANRDFALAERQLNVVAAAAGEVARDGAILQLHKLYVVSDAEFAVANRAAAEALFDRRPAALWWLVKECSAYPATAAQARALQDLQLPVVPAVARRQLAQITLNTCFRLIQQQQFVAVRDLGERVVRWPVGQWEVAAQSKVEEVLALWCWLGRIAHSNHGGGSHRHLLEGSVHAAEQCLTRGLRRPYEIEAAAAMARAALLANDADDKVVARARAELTRLLEPQRLQLAHAKAETSQHEQGIAGTAILLRAALADLANGR